MSCFIKDHRWRPTPRNPNVEECEVCHDRFPCPEKDCGHFDCVAVREETRCTYCRHLIEGAQAWAKQLVLRESERPYDTFVNRRGHNKAAHKNCRDKAIVEEQAEAERKQRMASGDVRLEDIDEETP